MRNAIRILSVLLALLFALSCAAFASSEASSEEPTLSEPQGEILEIAEGTRCLVISEPSILPETIELDELVIEGGGVLAAPSGHAITLTVNGIETGQALITTDGTETAIQPGTYRGNVVLTVTESNNIVFQTLVFPIRQAVYLDEDGVNGAKSVAAAVIGDAAAMSNYKIFSTGECFNGIYAAGGDHTIRNVTIHLTGNGRSDMATDGAAIVAAGEGTRLVIDGCTVVNRGVVRTAAICADGANLVVKNSTLVARDGVLPEDYVPSASVTQMRGGFPVGGSTGNCRATNLLGEGSRSTYINSWISADGWGVLSTDNCTEPYLTAINSVISVTGDDIGGYGAYCIGNVTERFLGCTFDTDFDIVSLKGGWITIGDSDREAVAALNGELELGLTDEELDALEEQGSTISSRRFGFLCAGLGTVDITGHTVIRTGETFFLNKGKMSTLTVDGSRGASIYAANGIIMQVMDSDDPGPTGKPYTEPAEDPVRDESFDVTAVENAAVSNFSNIELEGDFYNAVGYTIADGKMNMALNFDNAAVTGVITSSSSDHLKDEIYINEEDYKLFGVLVNTPCPAVNNGVIVSLANGSVWNVTGESYLTSLTVDGTSAVNGSVTVDGAAVDTSAGGSWTGSIVVVPD